jgi:hypothetical protein
MGPVIMFGVRSTNSIQFLIGVLLKMLTQQIGSCVQSFGYIVTTTEPLKVFFFFFFFLNKV